MSDGRLEFEIKYDGTQQAAQGLDEVAQAQGRVVAGTRPVAQGLDAVARAQTGVKDSSYSAREFHEQWTKNYREETFSELAEKIKRISHVSKETNPSLRWMGDGFKYAGAEASAAGVSVQSIRSGAVAASSASLAFARLMQGDFVGAARSAAFAMRTLHSSMSAGLWSVYAAGAIAAISGIIYILEKARQKKAELERSNWAATQAGWGVGDTREERENPYAEGLKGKTDADLAAELKRNESAYADAKAKRDAEGALHGTFTDPKAREEHEKQLGATDQEESDKFNRLKAAQAEQDRRDVESGKAKQEDVDRRQRRFEEQAAEEDLQRGIHRENVYGRRDLERDEEIAGIDDPIKKLEKRRGYLEQDRRVQQGVGGVEAEAKILAIDRELLDVRLQIGQESKAQAQADADRRENESAIELAARQSLEARRAEYEFSKKSAQEQLAIVDAQMAALRKSEQTTSTKTDLLDLQIRRDAIVDRIDVEDGEEGDDEDAPTNKKYSLGESRASGRRKMGGRNARDWMRQQMAARRAASGYGPSAPAASGESQKPVEVKGVDKTNELLGILVEKVS